MLFDSHCHPQFPQYDQDRKEILERAAKEGVFIIAVGTDLETSKKAITLAKKYEGIWATVGLHPNDNLNEKFDAEIYKKLLPHPKVIGFGEIGLDYYRTKDPKNQEFQKQRFEEQLEWASKIEKPLVLHCRNAHQNMIEILNSKFYVLSSRPIGVVHSFAGALEEAKKYLDLGFYLGFNGILTFTNQYDETVKYAPIEKILVETDAPYLAPVPFRGKRNEPTHIKYVVQKIAELKNMDYDAVAEQTFENTKKLFGI